LNPDLELQRMSSNLFLSALSFCFCFGDRAFACFWGRHMREWMHSFIYCVLRADSEQLSLQTLSPLPRTPLLLPDLWVTLRNWLCLALPCQALLKSTVWGGMRSRRSKCTPGNMIPKVMSF
jgi:hypothetical protein